MVGVICPLLECDAHTPLLLLIHIVGDPEKDNSTATVGHFYGKKQPIPRLISVPPRLRRLKSPRTIRRNEEETPGSFCDFCVYVSLQAYLRLHAYNNIVHTLLVSVPR